MFRGCRWRTPCHLCQPTVHLLLTPSRARRCWHSRIVLSMLGELKRYCPYKDNGCKWVGELEHVRKHAKVRCPPLSIGGSECPCHCGAGCPAPFHA